MRSKPNRFLHATLCLENLSSGENLAGCADSVGFPSGPVFCNNRREKKEGGGGEFRDEFSIERAETLYNVVASCVPTEKKDDKTARSTENKDNDNTCFRTSSVYTRFPSSFR